jgi:hypothetical protein
MKQLILLLSLIVCANAWSQWFYGTGKAVNLENDIGYNKNTQLIKSGVTLDPKTAPVNAGAGSLILKTDGSLYVKKDAGNTTNWDKILDETFIGGKSLIGVSPLLITQDATTATFSVESGYAIPTTASITSWDNKITKPASCGDSQHVAFNGTDYICVDAAVSAGQASNYFFIDAPSGISTYEILSRTASTSAEELDSIPIVVNNTDTLYNGYADGAIGSTSIEAGVWEFNMYRAVNATAGTTELVIRVYSRTTLGSETELFNLTTGDIQDTAITLQKITTTQPAFTVNATDVLVVKIYGKTTSQPKTVSFTHNGNTRNSFIASPISVRHNQLVGLQGGISNEYYHLSAANAALVPTALQTVVTDATLTGSGTVASPLSAVSSGGGKNLVGVSPVVITQDSTTATFSLSGGSFDANTASITGYAKSASYTIPLTATMSVNKAFSALENSSDSKFCNVYNEQPTNGTDGASTGGSFNSRQLQYISGINYSNWCSLNTSTNVVTLEPGTYRVTGTAPSHRSGEAYIVWYNQSAGSYTVNTVMGTENYNDGGAVSTTTQVMDGIITITSATEYKLLHWIGSSNPEGLGISITPGQRYRTGNVMIQKLK